MKNMFTAWKFCTSGLWLEPAYTRVRMHLVWTRLTCVVSLSCAARASCENANLRGQVVRRSLHTKWPRPWVTWVVLPFASCASCEEANLKGASFAVKVVACRAAKPNLAGSINQKKLSPSLLSHFRHPFYLFIFIFPCGSLFANHILVLFTLHWLPPVWHTGAGRGRIV